jgi:hypothetical protein
MQKLDSAENVTIRLAYLEREARRWRIAAAVTTLLLGATALTAFREARTQPLEGDSLTLHGSRGMAVTLAVTQSGELEARFDQGAALRKSVRGASLVLVDPNGRTIARLGEPVARQLRP